MSEPNETINIEEIMQAVRQQILEKKGQTAVNTPTLTIQGKRLPPDFYEHLYQAGMTYDQIQPKLYVTANNIPLIGGLLQTLRQKIHELVLFYVNQLAVNQIQVNHHLLQALNILAAELEREESKA
jgi:hypothetical protein